MRCLPPKCMQQIATLIITFATYVAGIRNAASGSGSSSSSSAIGAIADYESFSAPYNEDFRPSQLLSEVPELISTVTTIYPSNTQHDSKGNSGDTLERRQSSDFRPSQIIEFTPSDAQSTLKRYPPNYLERDYAAPYPVMQNGLVGNSNNNGDANKNGRFSFPAASAREQQGAPSTISPSSATYGPSYIFQHEVPVTPQVPTQLQTTPILTYRDPYTNELNTNHQLGYQQVQTYRPPLAPQRLITAANGVNAPQEYTVQSVLIVGADQSHRQHGQHGPHGQQGQNGENGQQEQKRPGYVFDEQLSASHARPGNQLNFATNNNRRGEAAHADSYKGSFGLGGGSAAHLSYDSHDYPPPSYAQQQTSNFQSPQRYDTDNYQAGAEAEAGAGTGTSLAAANYANKYGNYLTADGGNYKRPPPHFSNDIQYAHAPQRPPTTTSYYTPPPQQQLQQQQQLHYARPGQAPFGRPTTSGSNDYYQYQLGEIPPPRPPAATQQQRPPLQGATYYPPPPHYRPPYRPPPQATGGYDSDFGYGGNAVFGGNGGSNGGGVAGLLQYAPQFTNLLLGGLTGGNSGSGGIGGTSLLSALTGTTSAKPKPGQRPLNTQLIKALENIARNDDLQCVPKVLCQMIAGQTQRGQLPSFVTSPAITNFLAGFPAASPALIYGRAALLGISGGERSCIQTYAKCPKNEYEILYYLNNHRGGFFKFFSEPEEQTTNASPQNQHEQQSATSSGGSASLFSLLSALTGADTPTTTTLRPQTTPPTLASFDITEGIGNFFNNLLSDYLGGGGTVEYQRRRRRRKRAALRFSEESEEREIVGTHEGMAYTDSEDFHDEEDEEDTQNGVDFIDEPEQSDATRQYDDVHGRILFREEEREKGLQFFPVANPEQMEKQKEQAYLRAIINDFNQHKSQRKLKFPNGNEKEESSTPKELHDEQQLKFSDERPQSFVLPETTTQNTVNFLETPEHDTRRGKAVVFKDSTTDNSILEPTTHVIFPDHYETHIRKGKILNKPILYAANYGTYNSNDDRLVIPNSHRPRYEQTPSDTASNIYGLNAAYYSQSSSTYNTNTQTSTSIHHTSDYNGNRGGNGNYYGAASSSNRFGASSASTTATNYHNRPNYYSSGGASTSTGANHYNYPNSNYVSNNRYSSRYQTTRAPRGDDPNVYVTDGQGVTSYYITPDGRRINL